MSPLDTSWLHPALLFHLGQLVGPFLIVIVNYALSG
jgi:hypothetical protein